MKAKICTYYGNKRGAYTLSFDDGCYYESTAWVLEIFKEQYEKTGVKLRGTIGQTVNFLNERLIELWKKAFHDGYFDLAGHSMSHDISFNEQTPLERRRDDARKTREALKKIYDIAPSIYILPNGGHTKNGILPLKELYEGVRGGDDQINYPSKIDWYDIKTFTAKLERGFDDYKKIIDNTIENGGWSVQMNHWITKKKQDTFHSQSYESFRLECEYLVDKEGELWLPTLNEAVAYLRRAEGASLDVSEQDGIYTISVQSNKTGEFYNVPLTIMLDEDFEIVEGDTPQPKYEDKRLADVIRQIKIRKI